MSTSNQVSYIDVSKYVDKFIISYKSFSAYDITKAMRLNSPNNISHQAVKEIVHDMMQHEKGYGKIFYDNKFFVYYPYTNIPSELYESFNTETLEMTQEGRLQIPAKYVQEMLTDTNSSFFCFYVSQIKKGVYVVFPQYLGVDYPDNFYSNACTAYTLNSDKRLRIKIPTNNTISNVVFVNYNSRKFLLIHV